MSTCCTPSSTSPQNPLITLWTNVCQKTTSQMRTLRIQWHTWITAGRVHCQTSAAVESIKDKLKRGLCRRQSICYPPSIEAYLFPLRSKLCVLRKNEERRPVCLGGTLLSVDATKGAQDEWWAQQISRAHFHTVHQGTATASRSENL